MINLHWQLEYTAYFYNSLTQWVLCVNSSGVDILSDVKTSAITKFGRPEWDDVFSRATADFPKEKNVGVFFCGPNPLARVLRTYCKKYSNSQKKYHLLKESFG